MCEILFMADQVIDNKSIREGKWILCRVSSFCFYMVKTVCFFYNTTNIKLIHLKNLKMVPNSNNQTFEGSA